MKTDLKESKKTLKDKLKEAQQFASGLTDSGGSLTPQRRAAFDKLVSDIKGLKQEIQAESSQGERSYEKTFSEKSVGQEFIESNEFQSFLNKTGPYESQQKGNHMIEPFSVKDVHRSTVTRAGVIGDQSPDFFRNIQRISGITTSPERAARLSIRNLFPVKKTTDTHIEFFRHLNVSSPYQAMRSSNGAGLVPQSGSDGDFSGSGIGQGVVPKMQNNFVALSVPVATIAHYEQVHRDVLQDEQSLMNIINNELLYGLRLREDEQLLYGSSDSGIYGFMRDVDITTDTDLNAIQRYEWSDGEATPVRDNRIDAVRRALTLCALSYYQPTGLILNPTDFAHMDLTKTTDGIYIFPSHIRDTNMWNRLWNLPIIVTPAMREGEALIGAFGMGATLYDRQDTKLSVSDEHADLFVRRALAVMVEERIALAVTRPDAFVRVDFDYAPSNLRPAGIMATVDYGSREVSFTWPTSPHIDFYDLQFRYGSFNNPVSNFDTSNAGRALLDWQDGSSIRDGSWTLARAMFEYGEGLQIRLRPQGEGDDEWVESPLFATNEPPGPVVNVSVTGTTATLTWDAVAPAVAYTAYYQAGGAATAVSRQNGTGATITGLFPGATYTFWVVAHYESFDDNTTADGRSADVTATTMFNAPSAPEAFTAALVDMGDGALTLSFTIDESDSSPREEYVVDFFDSVSARNAGEGSRFIRLEIPASAGVVANDVRTVTANLSVANASPGDSASSRRLTSDVGAFNGATDTTPFWSSARTQVWFVAQTIGTTATNPRGSTRVNSTPESLTFVAP